MVGPGFFASGGDIKYEVEEIPAGRLDGGLAGGDTAGVEINQVGPFFGESGAGADLDNGDKGEAVRGTLTGGEDMHIHRGELLGAADEVAGGGGGEDEARGADFLAVGGDGGDGGSAGLGDAAEGFFNDIREAAALVTGGGIGGAVGSAAGEVFVVPLHFVDEGASDIGSGTARGEEVNGVAHFGDFTEQDSGAGADEQVGGETDGGVGGDAGEGVAASALEADDQA
jgi:hypothetical protein